MSIERYTTTTPTSGLANITPRKWLSLFFDKQSKSSYVSIPDETIDVGGVSSGKFRLDFVPKGAPGDLLDGTKVLRIFSSTSLAGTEFTPIKADAEFGEASAREFRYYLDDNAIDFDPSQISDSGFTTLYATYKASHSKTDPEWKGQVEQQLDSHETSLVALGAGTQADSGTFQATAGEALVEGTVYIDPTDSAVYQHDTPSSLIQSSSVGWVTTSFSVGETVTVYYRGKVEKPSAITSLPIGKDIWAGASNMPTWDNDSSNALTSGDYRAFLGRSYDGNNLWLNCNCQLDGVEA